MLRLLTFGGLALVRDDGSTAPRVRPPRLALLAALAVAGERGVSRERLMSFFWPDSDEARGRHSLRQALYVLRQELGRDVVRTHEATLSLDPSAVVTDVAEFRVALSTNDRARAVAVARGPFLDGFYLPGAPEFERWVEDERARFMAAVTGALLALATEAGNRRDRNAAAEWWRQLTVAEPLSGRFAAGYLTALAAQGDRARALAFARDHTELVRREIGAQPDADVVRIEAMLRSGGAAEAYGLASGAAAPASAAPNVGRPAGRPSVLRLAWVAGAVGVITLVATAALARQHNWIGGTDSSTLAASDATAPLTSSSMAHRLYDEGVRAYDQGDSRSASRLMRAALEEDSTFAMAAYYEAVLALSDEQTPDGRSVEAARLVARRLAVRAPERERLLITAHMLRDDQSPDAVAVAETLATRYPNDPDALRTVGYVRSAAGDWSGAAAVLLRAITIDSAAGTRTGSNCRLCRSYRDLGEIYFWWDSLPAALRVAGQLQDLQPNAYHALYMRAVAAARLGDSVSAYGAFRRLLALNGTDRTAKLDLDAALEEYDVLERDVRQLLASSRMQDWGNGAWVYLIALRNQGRLREAGQFHRTGTLPGLPVANVERTPDAFNEAILALERGDPRRSAAVFDRLAQADLSLRSPGYQARHRAWNRTLQGMALAAAGDTSAVRLLADTVERWGRASLYGRDRKAHHYLRGLVLTAEGRHDDAVREYRSAIHSPSLGFTRANYELAGSLLRLGRPLEAAAALQPALRGEIDAANLYVTRTEIHERLAQAFDAAGVRDSAARHYGAVVKAWARADPAFHARRDAARRWLAWQTGLR
ncbi:MAG TPA: BTAD domain-containing putative transcriptional regulator [Gemmatimonadaceae bacterium]|nr:BTAD domain-containing putative transcriptional regulator [Gemmatimonadaceae bacterium]